MEKSLNCSELLDSQEGFQPPSYDYDPPIASDILPPAAPVSSIDEATRYRKTQRPAAWKDQDLDDDSAYGSSVANSDYGESAAGGDYDLEGRDYRYLVTFNTFFSPKR